MKNPGFKRIPVLPGQQKITAHFNVEEFLLVSNSINQIEVDGSHVKNYLEVKEFFQANKKRIKEGALSSEDIITVDLPVKVANNILLFVHRIPVNQTNALFYQNFIDSIIKSTEEELKKHINNNKSGN